MSVVPRKLGDHPRGCGENMTFVSKTVLPLGSPPRMRGKLSHSATALFGARITPADAGKTVFGELNKRTNQDHPRGCGENFIDTFSGRGLDGSPPRMRGKRWRFCLMIITFRITPADAGKTHTQAGGAIPARDHPRGCGENRNGKSNSAMRRGSPPRMRGKPLHNTA